MKNNEIKFERLKKSYKKQIIIGSIFICVISNIVTFATTKAKYKLTQSIDLVKGTINYKVPDFRIVALYTENSSGTYIEASDIPTSGYTLNTDKSMCKVYDGSTSIESAPKDNNVTINYHDGVIGFDNISKKNTRCYLYFDKYIPPITMDNIIAGLNAKITTPTFSSAATTDEGIYKAADGMYGGTSYYWRGSVTNNYVMFASKCWRIVRINGDKTMRLIYDGSSCHANGTSTAESIAKTSQTYNTSYDRSEYVGWTYSIGTQRTTSGTASNVKSQTNSWYSSNITGTNATKVADGKYCNDRNIASGYSWGSQPSTFYYAGYDRSGAKSESSVTPTLSCPSGDIYTLKVND